MSRGSVTTPPFYKEQNMTTDVDIDEKIKLDIREPSVYNVIMLNDDTTPIEYMPVETRDAPVIFASGRISSPPFHATMALHSFYLSNQTVNFFSHYRRPQHYQNS